MCVCVKERLEKKNASSSTGLCSLTGSVHSGAGELENKVQEELDGKNKELMELRHAHNKLKKALQDRSVELSHGLRRAEHSEAEVRLYTCSLFDSSHELCITLM